MISIIIPTLNEEKILEKTLLSLRQLRDIPYEIIISDGKSTDRTVEIAKQYADKVVVYEGQKRQTIAMARNLGAREARGDFFVFIDADVFIPDINSFFKKALHIFDVQKKLAGLSVFLKVLSEYARFSDTFFFGLLSWSYIISNNIFGRGMASGEFQMIRADIFKKLNGYNETLVTGEDFDMFSRLSRIGKTRLEPSLHILHTSRRAYKVRWPKLLFSWFMNTVDAIRGRSRLTEWEEIR